MLLLLFVVLVSCFFFRWFFGGFGSVALSTCHTDTRETLVSGEFRLISYFFPAVVVVVVDVVRNVIYLLLSFVVNAVTISYVAVSSSNDSTASIRITIHHKPDFFFVLSQVILCIGQQHKNKNSLLPSPPENLIQRYGNEQNKNKNTIVHQNWNLFAAANSRYDYSLNSQCFFHRFFSLTSEPMVSMLMMLLLLCVVYDFMIHNFVI